MELNFSCNVVILLFEDLICIVNEGFGDINTNGFIEMRSTLDSKSAYPTSNIQNSPFQPFIFCLGDH